MYKLRMHIQTQCIIVAATATALRLMTEHMLNHAIILIIQWNGYSLTFKNSQERYT